MRQSFALKHLLIATVMVAALLPHGVGAARYDQAPSDGARRERLFEWSPLVRDIQNFLTEFSMLPAPADGRISPELQQAIRAYQRQHGLIEDGEASGALLRHMENTGRPAALKERLAEARREQTERAREALLANPETRDLLDAPSQTEGSQKGLSAETCLQSPSPQCLIDEALLAAAGIDRNDYRDWALREIVRAQALKGSLPDIRASIRRIGDVRLVVVSLREAAIGLVDSGHLDDARALAMTNLDDGNRARVLAAITIAEAKPDAAGKSARPATLTDLLDLLSRLDDPVAASEITAEVAGKLDESGLTPEAAAMLAQARRFVGPGTSDETRQTTLGILAGAYARIGRTTEALAILTALGDIGRDHIALAETAGQIAQGRLPKEALALADKLRTPRLHVLALSKIAAAQLQQGNRESATQTLRRAMTASLDIVRPFAADTALAEIAEVWAGIQDYTQAFSVIEKIRSRTLRAQTVWRFAAGNANAADNLQGRAIEATDAVNSAFDRASILTGATILIA
ncbi:MAG: peptidoglycan-binding domain-containing protein, partial [Proteobacteria bacterium]|nr:peptidoglycan-binding domain-containing protein [Pseudomonadota bacterium]